MLEAVVVLELVGVRVEVEEAVDVLLLVEVLLLVPEAKELLEVVDVLDVVVVLVDVRLAREEMDGGRDGAAVLLSSPLRVDVRVDVPESVGRAFAPIKCLGAHDGWGWRTSICVYRKD